MKNQISLNNINVEDNFGPGSLPGCLWWRMAAKFEECANFKLEMHTNLSKLTPRHRVLRELERLALIASDGGLDELRHKLFSYRSGDLWVPTGGIEKENLDISPLNTILLVGFHNAGKSSLVNLMYSVLGRSGLIPFAQTSSPTGSVSNNTGLFMEEHNVLRSMRNGFCVYDTRGFDYDRVEDGIEELSEWMTDGVHHNQLCLRAGDDMDDMLIKDESDAPLSRSSSMFATRRVNCVMVVANIAEIHKALKACDKQPLDALRQLFTSSALKKFNENPILILTHGDKLSTEDRIEGRIKICEHLGISEAARVYDIVCLTEYGFLADEFDSVTAYALSEAVYRALLISDRDHLPKKKLQDWGLLVLSWLMCSIAGFFAFLARIFSTLGQMNKMKL